jgi:hypothetical protein
MSWRCWYCAWKVMVLSNSATTASKPPRRARAGLEGAGQRLRQEAQALQVAAVDSRRQPSSRVMRSVCAPVMAAVWPDSVPARAAPPPRNSRPRSRRRAAALELLLGAHDQVPLLLRQPLAHGRGGVAQAPRL